MVAIFSGNTPGLNLGSLTSLGRRGVFGLATQGRNGESAYVNVSSGDLVLQDLDALLAGLGPDALTVRTYNSQGTFDFDGNADGWQGAPTKALEDRGSGTLRRHDSDGSYCDYAWNATRQAYVSTVAAGSAVDTIVQNADGTRTWTDGATGARETYQAGALGLITSSADAAGNTLTYSWDLPARTLRVTTASGESVTYAFGGASGRNLLSVTTTLASKAVLSQVTYGYDAQNRLQTVSVALNPRGDVPAGSETLTAYTTTYAYDGTSSRVASVTQSDGTRLDFTYVLVNGTYRVATASDGLGKITRFAYDTAAGTTTVTDPLGVSTVYQYDAKGQLLRVRTGVTATHSAGLSELRYAYDALGNVTSMTDGLGQTATLTYDANGNLLTQTDAAGNVVARTYHPATNQLLTETAYAGGGATQPLTTRYVYDAGKKNLLRFVITPEGRVTEHRYDAAGLRTRTIEYSVGSYTIAGTPSEAQLQSWAAAEDVTRTERTDYAYDFRGQLKSTTTYPAVTGENRLARSQQFATGWGTDYATGQTIKDNAATAPDGTATAATYVAATTGNDWYQWGSAADLKVGEWVTASVWLRASTPGAQVRLASQIRNADGTWDIGTTDVALTTTWTRYSAKVLVTKANPASTLLCLRSLTAGAAFEVWGAQVERGDAPTGYVPTSGASVLASPGENRLGSSQQFAAWGTDYAGGQTIKDNAATAPDGTSTAATYTAATIANDWYQWGSAADLKAGEWVTASVWLRTSTPGSQFRLASQVYNADRSWDVGRTDVTVTSTWTRYSAKVLVTKANPQGTLLCLRSLTAGATFEVWGAQLERGDAPGAYLKTAGSASVRAGERSRTDYVYDERGELIQTVAPDGVATTTSIYDGLGRMVWTRSGAASGSPSSLTTTQYDDANRRTLVTLANGLVATSTYDAAGRLVSVVQSATDVAATTKYAHDADGRLVMTTDPTGQRSWMLYDDAGRKVADVDATGALTEYVFDPNGRITETIRYANRVDASKLVDANGNPVTPRLSALRPASDTARDQRSWTLYDAAGRLAWQVDGLGYVTRTDYDGASRVVGQTRYATPIDTAVLGDGVGVQGAENRLARSQQFAAGWGTDYSGGQTIRDNAATAPDGTTTAATYSAPTTANDWYQGGSAADLQAGDWVTASVWLRASTPGAQVRLASQVKSADGTWDTGTTDVTLTSTWTRYSAKVLVSKSNPACTLLSLRSLTAGATFEMWGAQVERGSVAGAQLHTTGFARVGLNLVGPAISALVPGVENRLARSQQFASWGTDYASGQTIKDNAATAPDGTSTAATYTAASTGNDWYQWGSGADLQAGEWVTASVWLRASTPGVQVRLASQVFNTDRTWDVGTTDVTLTSTWTRYSAKVLVTKSSPANTLLCVRGLTAGATFEMWGAQLERGETPSGYLRTSGTPALKPNENRLPSSQQFAAGWGTDYAGGQTIKDGVATAPDGTATAATYTAGTGGNDWYQWGSAANLQAGQWVTASVWLRATTPGVQVRLASQLLNADRTWDVGSSYVTLTSTWTRYSARVLATQSAPSSTLLSLVCVTPGATFEMWGAQVEGGERPGAYVKTSGSATVAPAQASRGSAAGFVPAGAEDRVTRNVYDKQGLLRASVDGEGYPTEYRYDAAGRLVQTIRYATKAPGFGTAAFATSLAAARSSGTITALLPTPDAAKDVGSFLYYDAAGRVIGQVDGEGYLTETVYDANGNVARTVRYATAAKTPISATSKLVDLRPASSPADQVTGQTFDAFGRLATRTNPEGTATRYTYDAVGHLLSTTVALDTADQRTTTTRYDALGRVTAELSAVGASKLTAGLTAAQVDAVWAQYQTQYAYDAAGRRISTTDAKGNKTFLFHDEAGRLRYTVNALGECTESTYDALGHLTGTNQYATRIAASTVAGFVGGVISSSANAAAKAALDAAKAAATATAPNTARSFIYDALGQLRTATDALGNARSSTYDAFGGLATFTDPSGPGRTATAKRTYDRRGLLVKTVADAGTAAGDLNVTTLNIYDAFGRLVSTTDPNGNVSAQQYDRLGRVVQTVDPNNAVRKTTYDAFSRVVTQTDACGFTTTYAYDPTARSVKITTPEGVSITRTYNREGQLQTLKDGRGNVTTYAYDQDGNLLTKTQPVGSSSVTTTSVYDEADRLVRTVDANGTAVTYAYDAAGRMWQRAVDPAGLNLVTTFAFDAKGQQVSVTDANGVVTKSVFDAEGRMTSQTVDPTGLNLTTSYTYDARGQKLTVTSPGGTLTQYTYDDLGRLTQKTVDPNGTLKLTERFAYDAAGNLISKTDASGNVTRYLYDAAGRLFRTVDGAGNVRQSRYDAEGRLVTTTTYLVPIAVTGLAGLAQAALATTVAARLTGPTLTETRAYDRDGRLSRIVDGAGGVTALAYDANGNVIQQTVYANKVASPSAAPVPDPAHDQVTRTVYDALDRATFTMDGTGAVVKMSYDAVGNMVERIAYVTRVATSTVMTEAALGTAVAAIADASRDARVRRVYDRANRLTYSADGTGAVTRLVYDRNGNVVSRVAYVNTVAANVSPAAVVATMYRDRVELMAYDAANRLRYTLSPAVAATELVYDANGNVIRQVAYATSTAPVAAGTIWSVATFASLWSATGSLAKPYSGTGDASLCDRTTRMVYDAANRLVYQVAANGAVTKQVYDGAGNVIATVAYDLLATSLALAPTVAQVDAAVASAGKRTASAGFDGAGRNTRSVDAAGYVTLRTFDGAGRLLTVTQSGDASTPARTQTYAYDAAGHLTSSRDAMGFTETFTYDGAGNKRTSTNAKGATWTYDYDAAGRPVSTLTPVVDLMTAKPDPTGRLVTEAASAGILTVIDYDALGNVVARTEAAGRPEVRTTRYVYDACGRQTKTIYPAVGVYDVTDAYATNGANALADRKEITKTLSSEVIYDVFGQAVVSIDVEGSYSYKTYDSVGRVVHEVDPLGNVTSYGRNAFGDVLTLTRYAVAQANLRASGRTPLTTSQVLTELTKTGVDHSADRTITTQLDLLGRAVQIAQPSTWVSNGGAGYQAAAVTKHTYDAFGQVVQTSEQVGPSTWATTNRYYDARGLETATVDAMGYVTTRVFDAVGNLTKITEWFNPTTSRTLTGFAAPATDAAGRDRTVTYTYNLDDRKKTETRVGVELGATFTSNANGSAASATRIIGNLTTSYDYDAVGNLTVTDQEVGDGTHAITTSCYDALGRVTAILSPTRNLAGQASVTPVVLYSRDAHGNVVRQDEHVRGAAQVAFDENGVPVTTASGRDRVTLTRYDALGHAVQVRDAAGYNHYASYDAAGRVAKQWQAVSGNDGVIHTLYSVNRYDALGRQVATITPGTSSVVVNGTTGAPASIATIDQAGAGSVTTASEFNAFGELTRRGTFRTGAAVEYQEFFQYDNAGRAWRTNSGDGVVKVILYDLLGRVTVELQSAGSMGGTGAGVDLSAVADARAADALGTSGVRRTDLTLDLLGRALTQTTPPRLDATPNLTAAYRPVVVQTFDRWGNVLSRSAPALSAGAATVVTRYEYNANNQVIRQVQPSAASGAAGAGPETLVYHDGLGRQIATQDARVAGDPVHLNRQVFDAAGDLVQEIHADGGVVLRFYDGLGQQLRVVDAEDHVTDYAFDDLGRSTAITHHDVERWTAQGDFVVSRVGSTDQAPFVDLTSTFTYDQAGHKLTETNANGETTRYAYDLRGNLIATTLPLQQTTRAAFDAQGRELAEVDGNGVISWWRFKDAFGHLDQHGDLGGTVTAYTYDNAKQLVGQANAARGQTIKYVYDAAGQLIQMVDTTTGLPTKTTNYGYTTAGLRAFEETLQGSEAFQHQHLGYDYLGRLKTLETFDGIRVGYDYDAVGNLKKRQVDYTLSLMTKQAVKEWQIVGYSESSVSVVSGYDENGNPITTTQWVTVPNYDWVVVGYTPVYNSTPALRQDLYYAYDEMNRQVLVDGTVDNNVGNAANLQKRTGNSAPGGHVLTYDHNGNRLSDRYWGTQMVGVGTLQTQVADWGWIDSGTYDESGSAIQYWGIMGYHQVWDWTSYNRVPGQVVDQYTYDRMDRLSTVSNATVKADGSFDRAVQLDARRYDGASRLVQSGSAGTISPKYIAALTDGEPSAAGAITRVSIYDANGHLTSQRVRDPYGNWKYDQVYQRSYFDHYEWAQEAPQYDENGRFIGYGWDWFPRYRTVSGYDGAGNAVMYETRAPGLTSYYDVTLARFESYKELTVTGRRSDAGAAGTTTEKYDANGFLISIDDATKNVNDRTLVNDAAGHVLFKEQDWRRLRQLVVNGNVVAVYGEGTDPGNPTTPAGDPNFTQQQSFDLNYQRVNNAFPGAGTGQYAVRSGDTLQGIAASAYGDASLWYVIADANGLRTDRDLRAGATLVVPNRVTGAHNSSQTFKPYDPSVVGDTSPNLPLPDPPRGRRGCGVAQIILTVVVVAVAVAVTVYTAGAAASLMGASGGFFSAGVAALSGAGGLTGVAAAAIGGAVGSIASQALSMGFGLTEDFSWKQVGLAGLGAGLSAGAGYALGAAGKAAQTAQQVTATAKAVEAQITPVTCLVAGIRSAAVSAATQGLGVLTGLQKDFSWRSVAAAGVGATVGAAVGGLTGKGSDFAKWANLGNPGTALLSGTMAGIASGTTVALMRGGRVDMLRVSTDAFANALGNSLVETQVQSEAEAKAQAEQEARRTAKRLAARVKLVPQLTLGAAPAGQGGGGLTLTLGFDKGNATPIAVDEQVEAKTVFPSQESQSRPSTYTVSEEGRRGFWGVSEAQLRDELGRDPTNAEILGRTKELMAANPGVTTLRAGQELNWSNGTVSAEAERAFGRANAQYQAEREAAAGGGSGIEMLKSHTTPGAGQLALSQENVERTFLLSTNKCIEGGPAVGWGGDGLINWSRPLGAVKMVGGVFETIAGGGLVAVGAATSEIGVGVPVAIGGGVVVAHGLDTVVSGARTVWNGESVDTFTSQGLQAAGMSRTSANLVDAGVGVVGSLGAGAGARALAASEDAAITVAFKLGAPTGHNVVGVTTEAGTQWSHLAVRGADTLESGGSVVLKSGEAVVGAAHAPGAAYTAATVPVSAAQAGAALDAMQTMKGSAGAYSYLSNNCATYAADVMGAAGIATPGITTPGLNLLSAALRSPTFVGAASTAAAGTHAVTGAASPATDGRRR